MRGFRTRFLCSLLIGGAVLVTAGCYGTRRYGYQRDEMRGYGGSGYAGRYDDSLERHQRWEREQWERQRREQAIPPTYDPRFDGPRRYQEAPEGYQIY